MGQGKVRQCGRRKEKKQRGVRREESENGKEKDRNISR